MRHSVTLGLVSDAVEFTQIANVTEGGHTVASLHSANFARGTQQSLSYLFYRKALFVAKCS